MVRSVRQRAAWVVLAVAVLVGCLSAPAFAAGAAVAGHDHGRPAATVPALIDRLGMTSRTPVPCGWMVDVSAKTLNIAAPDTHTTYFVQPYYLAAGQQIVLNGVYPYSRYFSFVAYGSDGSPIANASIYDKQIVPDAGSVNPFTTVNPPTDQNQRRYTIRVTASQPPVGATNTIPGVDAASSQAFGFLVYRIYLPNDAKDPAAGVPLPTITTSSGTHRTCSRGERAVFNKLFEPVADALVAQSAPDPSTVVRGASLFRRAGNLAGLFPNPDNQYVFQASDWSPGAVIVIRGKAMTFPDTRHGGSTTERTDVRYWSMCSNELANPYPAIACASDDETALDVNGYYTYVVSMAKDRPRNATTANGVTWLAWAKNGANPVPPNTTYLRTMLPDPSFPHAVQAVPIPDPNLSAPALAAQAADAMQAYYPTGVLCTRATFEAGGAAACFGTP